MERRQFLKAAGGIGSFILARRYPDFYMKNENSELAEKVEFNWENKTIEYPEKLDFRIQHEENLLDDLTWEKPSDFEGRGDCDDYAVFILDALDSNGRKAACIGGFLEVEKDGVRKEGLHMWTEARLGDTNYVFDVNYRNQFVEKSRIPEELEKIPEIYAEKINYKPINMFDRDGIVSPYRPDF